MDATLCRQLPNDVIMKIINHATHAANLEYHTSRVEYSYGLKVWVRPWRKRGGRVIHSDRRFNLVPHGRDPLKKVVEEIKSCEERGIQCYHELDGMIQATQAGGAFAAIHPNLVSHVLTILGGHRSMVGEAPPFNPYRFSSYILAFSRRHGATTLPDLIKPE